MPAIAGVRLATAAAGIRYRDRTDVMLAVFDEGTSVAGVFTRSKCPSAPVEWTNKYELDEAAKLAARWGRLFQPWSSMVRSYVFRAPMGTTSLCGAKRESPSSNVKQNRPSPHRTCTDRFA